MTELEKCIIAKEKGYTYDYITGYVRGIRGNGKVISNKDDKGYIYVTMYVNKKPYMIKAHRLAWYLHYGELPANVIDHIDGNPANNRIENLRDVTIQQNNWNTHKSKGYSWNTNAKKYLAMIKINNKNKNLGCFNTEEEAKNAYLEAKKIYHIIPN